MNDAMQTRKLYIDALSNEVSLAQEPRGLLEALGDKASFHAWVAGNYPRTLAVQKSLAGLDAALAALHPDRQQAAKSVIARVAEAELANRQ